jgi:hypothetical protein
MLPKLSENGQMVFSEVLGLSVTDILLFGHPKTEIVIRVLIKNTYLKMLGNQMHKHFSILVF